jgi:SAM-dependent methyltransferase
MTDASMDTKEFIRGYFRDRAVAFPEFYKRRPLLPIEARIVELVPPDANVLDLCCGGGEVALAMAKKGATVTGVDNVVEMRNLCQDLFAEERQKGSFHLEDATKLPFGDCSFSHVVCAGNSLNSMNNEDARLTIKEAVRVTEFGGVLLLTVLNPASVHNLLAVARGVLQQAPAWGFYYHSNYGLQVKAKDAPRGMSFLIPPYRMRRYLREAGLVWKASRWDIGFSANHLLLICCKAGATGKWTKLV